MRLCRLCSCVGTAPACNPGKNFTQEHWWEFLVFSHLCFLEPSSWLCSSFLHSETIVSIFWNINGLFSLNFYGYFNCWLCNTRYTALSRIRLCFKNSFHFYKVEKYIYIMKYRCLIHQSIRGLFFFFLHTWLVVGEDIVMLCIFLSTWLIRKLSTKSWWVSAKWKASELHTEWS